jgi:hypothetical protein
MYSVFGKWKLIREGSDYLPGVDKLIGSPLVMRLVGNADAEFLKISKRKFVDVEEICVSYVTKNSSLSSSFQIGTINFEQVTAQDIILTSVQSCDQDFTEFTIARYGPKCAQNR